MASPGTKFTIEDLIVKRLWVEDKRIDSFNLGALVIRDENYNIGVNTDDPEITLDISGNSGIRIPIGNDSFRPNISEMTGILRYNNDSAKEYYESYIQGSWRPIGGSNLELCTFSASNKSSILINKKGLTTSNDGGTIEFNLESDSGIQSKQAKILAKNVSSAGNGSLTFQTAENDSYHDRIFIKNNGDVGIGNASPGKKLHVSGDVQAQDIFTDGGLKNINSTGTFVNLGTNEIYLGVNGTAQLYVSSNNNVGIGTQPSSSYKLHVNGSIAGQNIYASLVEAATINATSKLGIKQNSPQVVLDINDTGAIQLPKGTTTQRDSLPTIRQGMIRYNTSTEQFEGYGAGNAWGSLGGVKDIDQDTFITVSNGITDTDEIKFFAGNATTEKMIIKSSGDVGIGTTSPGAKLHIYEDTDGSTANKTMLLIQSNPSDDCDAYDWNPLSIDFKMANQTDDYTNIARISAVMAPTGGDTHGSVTGEGNNALLFHTSKNTTLSERMRINHNGYVGIGETSPDNKLHLKGDGGSSAAIKIESSNSSGAGFMYIQRNTDGKAYVLNTGAKALILGANNNTSQLYLKENGYVGIGKNNPGYHLDVNGTIKGTTLLVGSTNVASALNNAAPKNNPRFTGYVGIGTTSPMSELHVNGNIEVDGNIEANNTTKQHVDHSRLYSCGQSVMCVLNTGKLLTAGYGGWYQLLNGSSTTRVTLTDVYDTMTENTGGNYQTAVYDGNNAREVSQGSLTDYVLLSSGAILSGGRNNHGQLGANHTSSWVHFDRVFPNAGYNGMNAVKLAKSSKEYTMGAILNTGQIILWGEGAEGQMGNNATTSTNTKPIAPWTSSTHYTGTNAVEIDMGAAHTVVLLNNGQVTCCGRGAEGQLGNGATSGKSTFQIVDTSNSDYDGTNAIDIAAGWRQTYILLNTGTIVAFGYNAHGNLGINNTSNQAKPVNLSHNSGYDGTNAVAIQAGDRHLVVLLNNGKVLTCGFGAYGQLGNNSTSNYRILIEPQHNAGYNGGNVKSLLRLSRFSTAVMLDNEQIISCGEYYGAANNDWGNRSYFQEVTHTSGYNGKNVNYDNFSPLTIKPTNTFFNGGNVAIGSCVAPATLTVGGGSAYHPSSEGVIAIGRSNGVGTHRWVNLSIDSNFFFRIGDGGTGLDSTTTNTGFFKCAFNAPNNSFYMNGSGNVGIGTSSPGAKLQVIGTLSVKQSNAGTDEEGMYLYSEYSNGNTSSWIRFRESNNDLYGCRLGYDGTHNLFSLMSREGSTIYNPLLTIPRNNTSSPGMQIYAGNGRFVMNGVSPGMWFGQGDSSSQTFFGEYKGDGSPYIIGFHRGGWYGPFFESSTGWIGIKAGDPTAPLDIEGTVSASADKSGWWDGYDGAWYGNDNPPSGYHLQTNSNASFGDVDYNDGAVNYSIHCKGGIYMEGNSIILITSDRRIKKEIVHSNSNDNLNKLRNIPIREYKYKDIKGRGSNKTLGFIAQEVDEQFAMAVTKKFGCIPNEYRRLEDYTWSEVQDISGNIQYKLTINDLIVELDFQRYRFYVTDEDINDLSEDEIMFEKVSLKDEQKSFLFKKKWKSIFLWGQYVANFHTIDKHKLFTLNFSATQEIDKIQQAQIKELSRTKQELLATQYDLSSAKKRIDELENKLQNVLNRLDNLENK